MKNWKYYVASCAYRQTKKPGFFSGDAEGGWVLHLDDGEYPLPDGLNRMGSQGYELVGIQPAQMRTGGQSPSWYNPETLYIFKQPLDT